jgi:spoIIIJ-associated protein
MREVERSAASVEEAVEAALDELGVSEQEAQVEIVQEPQKGLLGFGSQEAIVRVRARDEDIGGVALEEQAEAAEEFVQGLLDRMGLDADVDHNVVDGVMYVDILAGEDAEEMGLLIGRHGQTLDALQELARTAVQRRLRSRVRLLVDVEGYRARRRTSLAEYAKQIAERAKQRGTEIELEPMNSFERKIVHDAVAEVEGATSFSEGEEPARKVVVRGE